MAVLKQGRIFYWGKSEGFKGSKRWQEGWLILKAEGEESSPNWGPSLNCFKDSTCKKQLGKPIQLISVAVNMRFRTSAVQYGSPQKKDPRICSENLIGIPLSPNKESLIWLCAFSVPELRKWLSAIARSLEGIAQVPEDSMANGVGPEHQNGHLPSAVEVDGTTVNKLHKADSLHDLLSAETHKADADWALYWWNMPEVDPKPPPKENGAVVEGSTNEVAVDVEPSTSDDPKEISGNSDQDIPADSKREEVAKTTNDTQQPGEANQDRPTETKTKSNQQTGDNETSKENLSGQVKTKPGESQEAADKERSEEKVVAPLVLSEKDEPTRLESDKKAEKEVLKSKLEEIEKEKLKKKAAETPAKPTRQNTEKESNQSDEAGSKSNQELDPNPTKKKDESSAPEKTPILPPVIVVEETKKSTEKDSDTKEKSSKDKNKEESKEESKKSVEESGPVTPRAKSSLGAPQADEADRQTVYFDSEQSPANSQAKSTESTDQDGAKSKE